MRWLIALLLCLVSTYANAQSSPAQTFNRSVSITTGSTFQQLVPSGIAINSVTIQNNNTTTTENCWIDVSGLVAAGNTLGTTVTSLNGSTTAAKASILLTSSSSYSRFTGHLLSSQGITGTCTSSGDSIYVDTQ